MHQQAVARGVPFGQIPAQYQDAEIGRVRPNDSADADAANMVQFIRQKRVAEKCKLSYAIYFENGLGFRGYVREAPQFAPHYRFQP